MKHKKAQHLTLTTLFVLFIFFLVLTLFFDEIFINPKMDEQRYRYLQQEASRAARTLASDGYPEEWDSSTVQRAGLLTDGIYNETKAGHLATMPYGDTKDLLGITSNYLLIIKNNGATTTIGPYGDEANLLADNPRYLATQTKTVTSETGIATITIYTYRGIP